MLVVDHYNFLPGQCALCGSSNLPAIDTGVDLDWQNNPHDDNPSAMRRFYICADCAINLAMMVADRRGVAVVQANTVHDLKTQAQEIAERNAELFERQQKLEAALLTIQSLREQPKETYVADEDVEITQFAVAKPRPKK